MAQKQVATAPPQVPVTAPVKNAKVPPKKPVVSVGDVLKEKYEVVKQLGQGGFGAVFQAKDKKSGELHALKVELELPKPDEPGLDLEIGVMKRMQSCGHIARFVDNGKLEKLCFVIMQLVGCNLSDLRKGCPELKFTESTAVRIAQQCLEGIEALHGSGLLHRDIKPANFAMGRTAKDYRNVYILDFGMVRRFKLKNGQVRPQRPVCGFRGTLKYASLNCHDGVDQGRVDDLWSWLYMLIEFVKGELPWRTEPDRQKIRNLKATSKATLCDKLAPELERVYSSLQGLKYADEPPYHWYKQKMMEILQRKQFLPSDPFDWEEKGAFFQQLKAVAPQPYEKQMLSKRKVIQEKAQGEKEDSPSEEDTGESGSTTTSTA